MNRLKNPLHFPCPTSTRPRACRVFQGTLICSIALWAQVACANWTWPGETVAASLSEGQWIAEFPFINTGKSPLTVQSLQFACTCDDYQFKATPAEPGKSGMLRVLLGTEPKGKNVEFVVFGSEDATPTMLTIELPSKPGPAK